jgi:hypothetical protein
VFAKTLDLTFTANGIVTGHITLRGGYLIEPGVAYFPPEALAATITATPAP